MRPRFHGTGRPQKGKFDESGHASQVHRRWLFAGSADLRRGRLSDSRYAQRIYKIFHRQTPESHLQNDRNTRSAILHLRHVPGDDELPYINDRENFDADECPLIRQDFDLRVGIYTARGEEVIKRETQYIEDFAADEVGIFWDRMGDDYSNPSQTPWFKYLYGDIHNAAIFVLEGKGELIDLIRSVKQDSRYVLTLRGRKNRTKCCRAPTGLALPNG